MHQIELQCEILFMHLPMQCRQLYSNGNAVVCLYLTTMTLPTEVLTYITLQIPLSFSAIAMFSSLVSFSQTAISKYSSPIHCKLHPH
ncbi:hypothetical protein TSMEX_009567 [Taenia solium]